MKATVLAGALIILFATNSWAATTVKSSKSNTSELRVQRNLSATANLTGPSNTVQLYTTVAGFVLTEICVSPLATGGIRLDVSGFGSIAHLGILGDGCHSFANGFLLPANSTISCSTLPGASPGNYFCAISGREE